VRTAYRWALLALLLVLAAAHVLYWYAPRERAASPAPEGLPARMLAATGYEACFWIPYPHQNLAALARALGDWEGYVAAASRLAGLPPPSLPGFGPFSVPPASEIAACSDASGRRVLVAAEIYPAIAVIAKAAGRLADNPWLAGGEVPGREQPTRVAWRGHEWTVSLGGEAPPADPPPQVPAGPPALSLLRLSRPISGSFTDLPAGTYRLERSLERSKAGDLELALAGSAESLPNPVATALPPESRPALLAAAGATEKEAAAALALFPAAAGGDLELPGAATFHPAAVPGRGRWSLPGGGLAGLLTRSLPRGNAAGWSIVAFDAASLARAEALAPGLARIAPPEVSPASASRLRLGLWIEPAAALDLVTSVRKLLEKVPLVGQREAERWRDGETLLTPLARCRELTLQSSGPPDSFALRLSGCR